MEARRLRKDPDTRRAEIVRHARDVFAQGGYAETGLAEVADAADVSKGLVYHYFPEGRPELFAAVCEDLIAELSARLRSAAAVPFSPARRMEQVLAALFGFFDENPEAFRILFRDSLGSRERHVEAAAAAAWACAAGVLGEVLSAASSGEGEMRDSSELLAASHGILGFAVAAIDLALEGHVDAETAWRVSCEYATVGLK
ncbi:MAG: hypothetical protein KatS3mg008_1344 [Acidimicrobiales bacterium]|nr:MAG: hypothetical protein KatS3mg008_1344 [Acidimicrobiales bacterium]